jgi:alpha-tubulin suppressor-like RCC1 family protein
MRKTPYCAAVVLLPSLAWAAGVIPAQAATIAAGGRHTCAIVSTGGAKCWGSNLDGELGDGTFLPRLTPVPVAELSGASAITAGDHHTCAIVSTGGARCWGYNGTGQLGNGETRDRNTPVRVKNLSGASAIAAGYYHTCALISPSGHVKCWGNNDFGQLGDNTTTNRFIPVLAWHLRGAIAIAAGGFHTCALISTGGVKCWGNNVAGQLGDGTTTHRSIPGGSYVQGLKRGVIAITAGSGHTCAMTTAGRIKCWGFNLYGQLGDGTTRDRRTPVSVKLKDASDIAAGQYHTCARIFTGVVKCWGENSYGQLGDGTKKTNRLTPVRVKKLSGVPSSAAAKAAPVP